ncbi:MAG: hypothetical protein EOO40_07950 [Deltaproteobacteria bacterium]|nr:MAG: hypothetical protein EOO40_07950 [Deltaproteobacteria bacterium]
MLIEATEQALRFDDKNNVLLEAADDDPLQGLQLGGLSAPDKPAGSETPEPPGVLDALSSLNHVSQRAAETTFTKEGSFTLAGSVKVLDVWTEGLGTALTEGETYLYFSPNGYTQEAFIHLEDAEKRTFTVEISGLTGRSRIASGYVEAPQ